MTPYMQNLVSAGYFRIANGTKQWSRADLTEWLTHYDRVGHVRYALLPTSTR